MTITKNNLFNAGLKTAKDLRDFKSKNDYFLSDKDKKVIDSLIIELEETEAKQKESDEKIVNNSIIMNRVIINSNYERNAKLCDVFDYLVNVEHQTLLNESEKKQLETLVKCNLVKSIDSFKSDILRKNYGFIFYKNDNLQNYVDAVNYCYYTKINKSIIRHFMSDLQKTTFQSWLKKHYKYITY